METLGVHLPSPEKPKSETEKHSSTPIGEIDRIFESSSQEAKRKIAETTGKFYKAVVDLYLAPGEELPKRISAIKLTKSLPAPMQRLFRTGLAHFGVELRANKGLIGDDKEEEKLLLLRKAAAITGAPIGTTVGERFLYTWSKISDVTERADEVKLIEPTPGLAILEVPPDLYQTIRDKSEKDQRSEHAVTFNSMKGSNDPTFIVMQTPTKEFLDPRHSLHPERTKRHEVHHFMWNFLERSSFTRPPNEWGWERTIAFQQFRNEMAAYVNKNWRNLGYVQIEGLVYNAPDEIKEEAKVTRDLAILCQQIAAAKNIPRESFLYPVMASDSFSDLEKRLLDLAPGPNELDLKTIILIIGDNLALRGVFKRYDLEPTSITKAARKYFSAKGIHIKKGELEKFAQDIDFSAGESQVLDYLLGEESEESVTPVAA